jgi:hypothetical protein
MVRPAFARTAWSPAGNASGINDAAAVAPAEERCGLQKRCRSHRFVGTLCRPGQHGNGPDPGFARRTPKAGWKIEDLDLSKPTKRSPRRGLGQPWDTSKSTSMAARLRSATRSAHQAAALVNPFECRSATPEGPRHRVHRWWHGHRYVR